MSTADFRSTLGVHCAFVGRCDATLETHTFQAKRLAVAVYVEKRETPSGLRRAPAGVVVVVGLWRWAGAPAG